MSPWASSCRAPLLDLYPLLWDLVPSFYSVSLKGKLVAQICQC